MRQHTIHDLKTWIGRDLVGAELEAVGTIEDLYAGAATDEPEWLSVSVGELAHVSFVALAQAERYGEAVRVPYDAATIKSAPPGRPDRELSETEQDELYHHYGLARPVASAPRSPYDADLRPTASELPRTCGASHARFGARHLAAAPALTPAEQHALHRSAPLRAAVDQPARTGTRR